MSSSIRLWSLSWCRPSYSHCLTGAPGDANCSDFVGSPPILSPVFRHYDDMHRTSELSGFTWLKFLALHDTYNHELVISKMVCRGFLARRHSGQLGVFGDLVSAMRMVGCRGGHNADALFPDYRRHNIFCARRYMGKLICVAP